MVILNSLPTGIVWDALGEIINYFLQINAHIMITHIHVTAEMTPAHVLKMLSKHDQSKKGP